MHSTRILCALLCAGVFISCSTLRPLPPPVSAPPPPTPEQRFKNAIDRVLEDSLFIPAHVGIKIISLSAGDVLYDLNSKKLFHPASNLKLFSSALALITLGKDFVFTTKVLADALDDSTVVDGNLYLKGSGNPDLTLDDLRQMVQQIQARGIRRIRGDLVGDVRYFDDKEWGSEFTKTLELI